MTRRARGSTAGQGASVVVGLIVCLAAMAAGVVLMLGQLVVPAWFCLALATLAAFSLLFRR
jgi:hypothetical protein